MKILKCYILVILLISSSHLFATTYTAIAQGSWDSSSTWSPSGIPGAGDQVIIDGFIVTHQNGTINVDQISITNISNINESSLIIQGTGKIVVKDHVILESENVNYDVRVMVLSFGELEVGGNITFDRKSDNTQDTRCALYILDDGKVNITGYYLYFHRNGNESKSELWLQDDGIMNVGGNFTFDRSGIGTGALAFDSKDNAQLNITGDLEANLIGGDMIDFRIIGQSSFSVGGNMTLNNSGGANKIIVVVGDALANASLSVEGGLNLNSTAINKLVEVEGDGSSSISVTGNLSLSAFGEATTKLTLASTSILNLGGTILRPNNYGIFNVGATATLNLNGTQPQTLVTNKLPSSGTDSIYYSNIVFNNSSGSPTTLGGPLVIDSHLAMDDGIIISSLSSPLILADNATIGIGNSTSFVDGPIIKKGRTGSGGLTFPIGKGSTYAPMSISEVTDVNAEVTVEYYSDPPPFGLLDFYEVGIESISQEGYWDVERNNAAGNLNYTLNWRDADALGINDLSSLIVTGFDNTTWNNYGQQSTTGGTGSGISGSITNAYSDPPPFGLLYLTFGTTSALNKLLPVELSKFSANPKGKNVELRWETEAEIAFSYFEVERSVEGRDFETLTTIEGMGGNNSTTEYTYIDRLPFNGMNYYRLKIVDLDGSYEYSNIEVVNLREEKDFEIYPNPVNDLIQIQGVGRENESMLFQVFDKTGKQIYENWINFENGYFQISSSEVNLNSTGIYLIKISSSVSSQEFKIIKIE